MKILIAPSEAKTSFASDDFLNEDSFYFKELNPIRFDILQRFDKFIQTNQNKDFCLDKTSIFKRKTTKAILRYDGVAFKYLNYQSLNNKAKQYLDKNLIIFSNLFGILKPTDKIPFYTLKQGKKPGFDIYKEYKDKITEILDTINEKEIFIDLRAKFYEKIYKPKNCITFTFYKNNKIVSHFAKKYRGIITREIAINNVSSIDDIFKIEFPNIQIREIIEKKNSKEIIFDILPTQA